MKNLLFAVFTMLGWSLNSYGQDLTNVVSKDYRTSNNLKIAADMGYLQVPENRMNPLARKIKIKYVHLKSLASNPGTPVVYLEGGGATSTWQAENPKDLSNWVKVLEVADLIFIDQRGTADENLTYIWQEEYPKDFLISEESANRHYQKMATAALKKFETNGIDISGYNISEHAKDVNALMIALGISKYSILGFSFGSQIGMTVMKLFPDKIEKAILVGADAPNQSFNFPGYFDRQVEKIGKMVKADDSLNAVIPDFKILVENVMKKLHEKPATVTIKNPLTQQDMRLDIGPFGLALILRLDIDDASDIPVIPRLLYAIDQGDYAMLTWFAQRRMVFGLALPGNGINQQLASGASKKRWNTILKEANRSTFGNVVNFPFSAVKDHWVPNQLDFDPSVPMKSNIPTLFITGKLDCRTPVEQVDETMKGFSKAIHVKVENAGHEQDLWEKETFNEIIPKFLNGQPITNKTPYYSKLKFLPVVGFTKGHPATQ